MSQTSHDLPGSHTNFYWWGYEYDSRALPERSYLLFLGADIKWHSGSFCLLQMRKACGYWTAIIAIKRCRDTRKAKIVQRDSGVHESIPWLTSPLLGQTHRRTLPKSGVITCEVSRTAKHENETCNNMIRPWTDTGESKPWLVRHIGGVIWIRSRTIIGYADWGVHVMSVDRLAVLTYRSGSSWGWVSCKLQVWCQMLCVFWYGNRMGIARTVQETPKYKWGSSGRNLLSAAVGSTRKQAGCVNKVPRPIRMLRYLSG